MADFRDVASAQDTIVAESTPRGAGAIAIVRLSGPAARAVAERLCAPAAAPADPAAAVGPRRNHQSVRSHRLARSHQLVRRRLVDAAGAALDEALVAYMAAPNTYTGEDVVELHLHGSPAVVEATLAACLAAGARLATPGEFTRRAFVHGKLDLAQAEAVGALVSAQSDAQRRAALQLLDGRLAQTLGALLVPLEGVVAAWRAALDFPDEVDAAAALPQALAALRDAKRQLQALLGGAQLLAAEAPQVVLLGDANVGKSTLLNALAGEERALVDAAPGTTRDAVAHAHAAYHVRFTLWDTAGLRAGATGVEARGVARARAQAQRADLRLWLTGAAGNHWPTPELGPVYVVGSQRDRTDAAGRAAIEAEAARRGLPFVGWICALEAAGGKPESGPEPAPEAKADADAEADAGVAALERWLAGQLRQDAELQGARQVLARRHQGLLEGAVAALEACLAGAATLPLDLLLCELETALARLGEVLGRDVDAAVLDRIFADFCLGK